MSERVVSEVGGGKTDTFGTLVVGRQGRRCREVSSRAILSNLHTILP